MHLLGVGALCKAGGLDTAAACCQPLVDGLQLGVAGGLRQVRALGTRYLRAGRMPHVGGEGGGRTLRERLVALFPRATTVSPRTMTHLAAPRFCCTPVRTV